MVLLAVGILALFAPPSPRDPDDSGKLIVWIYLLLPAFGSFWLIRLLIMHPPVLTLSRESLVIGKGKFEVVIPWTHIKSWYIELDYDEGDSGSSSLQQLTGYRYSLIILTDDGKPTVSLNGLSKGVEEIEELIMSYKPQK